MKSIIQIPCYSDEMTLPDPDQLLSITLRGEAFAKIEIRESADRFRQTS